MPSKNKNKKKRKKKEKKQAKQAHARTVSCKHTYNGKNNYL